MRPPIITYLITSILFTIIYSCNKDTGSNNDRWDSIDSIYVFESIGYEYKPPFLDQIIIADPASLPPEIKMCMVDTVSLVSIFLIALPNVPLIESEADKYLSDITRQEYPAKESFRYIIPDTSYENPGWRFRSDIKINNGTVLAPVTYYGYIVRSTAFVMTASDSVHESTFVPYINGFRKKLTSH